MSGVQIGILVLSALIAVLGFREAETFKKKTGIYPWRLPSIVWAAICLLSFLIGAILLAIARRTTKPRPGEVPGTGAWPGYPTTAGMPGGWPPGYPQAGYPQAGYPQAGVGPSAPAPGWYQDPAGRHEHRYWDGTRWTEHVSSAGDQSTDPPGGPATA